MTLKRCELDSCNKTIDIKLELDLLYSSGIVVFCSEEHKNKFINDYIKDNIWEIIRNNIDTAKEIVLN